MHKRNITIQRLFTVLQGKPDIDVSLTGSPASLSFAGVHTLYN